VWEGTSTGKKILKGPRKKTITRSAKDSCAKKKTDSTITGDTTLKKDQRKREGSKYYWTRSLPKLLMQEGDSFILQQTTASLKKGETKRRGTNREQKKLAKKKLRGNREEELHASTRGPQRGGAQGLSGSRETVEKRGGGETSVTFRGDYTQQERETPRNTQRQSRVHEKGADIGR